MDSERFDDIIRASVATKSRRGILKTIVGGALGAAFASVGVRSNEVAAQTVGPASHDDPTGGRCRANRDCQRNNPCLEGFCRRRGRTGTCVFRHRPNGSFCGGDQMYPDVCMGGKCVADDGDHSN